MQNNKFINLELIKPKVKGESDKYSWNFYKYLNKLKNKDVRIYYRTHSCINGDKINFNEHEFVTIETLVVSSVLRTDEGLIGSTLSNVLRGERIEEFYYSNIHKDYYEITEEFFNLYLDKGRCLFDYNHNGWLAYDSNRFTAYDDHRICNYCGKRQNKKVEIISEEVTNWI